MCIPETDGPSYYITRRGACARRERGRGRRRRRRRDDQSRGMRGRLDELHRQAWAQFYIDDCGVNARGPREGAGLLPADGGRRGLAWARRRPSPRPRAAVRGRAGAALVTTVALAAAALGVAVGVGGAGPLMCACGRHSVRDGEGGCECTPVATGRVRAGRLGGCVKGGGRRGVSKTSGRRGGNQSGACRSGGRGGGVSGTRRGSSADSWLPRVCAHELGVSALPRVCALDEWRLLLYRAFAALMCGLEHYCCSRSCSRSDRCRARPRARRELRGSEGLSRPL